MSDQGIEGFGRLFFEVHRDLPREGPGSTASTQKALALAKSGLPDAPRVVDMACGPGAQTLALVEALPPDASITAVDLHGPFLEQLRQKLKGHPGEDRVEVARGDMKLWTPDEPVDMVWCEGAAYIMGVGEAIERWRGWLAPGGTIALSEAVWLTDKPKPASAEMWAEYPAMGDVRACLDLIEKGGYDIVGHFVLPPSDWWTYYTPMQARIDALKEAHAHDPKAMAELAPHQHEIDVYRTCPDDYSYLFAVARKRA